MERKRRDRLKEYGALLGLWLWYGFAPFLGLFGSMAVLVRGIALWQAALRVGLVDHLLMFGCVSVAASAYLPLRRLSRYYGWSRLRTIFYALCWPSLFVAALLWALVNQILHFGL